MRSKKVAIIGTDPLRAYSSADPNDPTNGYRIAPPGAGPSGLVTAKTLIHNWPRGTYLPIVFDTRYEVGGLWAIQPPETKGRRSAGFPGTLDPCMRTNLSRFTVAFSELSWESALGSADVPMFPQARQVGQYLAAYTARYIPAHVLRLGHCVVNTERLEGKDDNSRWRVSWKREGSQNASQEASKIESEDFDLLVVASGYFARPYIPPIPGLEQFTGQVIHSSVLEKGGASFSTNTASSSHGHTVVVGGSMSGVEAASALALRESSSRLSTGLATTNHLSRKVYHIHSRPFWILPTYLPYEVPDDTVSFLPLDLAMYDLSRRPPGQIEYGLGPLSDEKIEKTNGYFRTLLGAEYESYGHLQQPCSSTRPASQPEWVAIGNDYAEFVRSGGLEPIMGRVTSIQPQSDTRIASIEIESSSGSRILDDVTTVVMATGFTPFDALSFLPRDVLSSLEYDTTDPVLPIILDQGGTLRSEMPDIGFVGFYRGPYWGVMEMQARLLGEQWAGQRHAPARIESDGQREILRALRQPSSEIHRGQFPMGDYVGLMEMFAKDLRLERTGASNDQSQTGPVIPARYHAAGKEDVEVRRTLDSLQALSRPDHPTAQAAASLAVFRALHGTWKVIQTAATGERAETGTVAFVPRYPSNPIYDREYVLTRRGDAAAATKRQDSSVDMTVFRLSEAGTDESSSRIGVYDVTTEGNTEIDRLAYSLRLTPLYRKTEMGEYVIHAEGIFSEAVRETHVSRCVRYTFHFQGVSIIEWECVESGYYDTEEGINGESPHENHQRTVYTR